MTKKKKVLRKNSPSFCHTSFSFKNGFWQVFSWNHFVLILSSLSQLWHFPFPSQPADMIADFKTASYVYLQKKGLCAEFMTCVEPDIGSRNGFHLNFSLWDAKGRNVLADPEDQEKLSEFGRHWLAGMIDHCPAMLALSSPTVNCYRWAAWLSVLAYALILGFLQFNVLNFHMLQGYLRSLQMCRY